jgi:hypothetical protein
MLAFAWLSHAQSVLDKLQQKVDQLNKPTPGAQQNQGPRPQRPPSQPNSNSQSANSKGTPPPEIPAGEVAEIARSAGFVDLAGHTLGMTVKDMMLALRAVNPDLILTPQTFRLPGFDDKDLLDTVRADSLGGREGFILAFTVAPGPEVLWGAQRMIHFADNERPTGGKVLADLQKRYGLRIGMSGTMHFWLVDGRGSRQAVNTTMLDGVSVTVNGKPAFNYYISATRINRVQATAQCLLA